MKLNTSYLLAGGLLVLGAGWFLLNNLGEEEALPVVTPATVQEDARGSLPTVQVSNIYNVDHPNVLELFGQTRAAREVAVKAETAGRVARVMVQEGTRVKRGQMLCRQDINARQALVDQAKANLRSVETDLNAARVLAEKGFQSSTRVTAFEAQLDGARAALKQAEIEADNVNIRAPFSGIWERQDAQVGDFLAPGQSCGLLVDLSPLEVDVQLTESQLGRIASGDVADIHLATGDDVTGEVAFIDAKADTSTRTFRAEIHVPNADLALKAGITATVRLTSGLTRAAKIPTNILSLNEAGDVGIRYVDATDTVRFAQVRTIDEDADGAWVTGLPDGARIITTGQDFVTIGQQVEPISSYGAGRSREQAARANGN